MAAPRKKRADASPAPNVSTHGGLPVYNDELITMISDLTEIVTWWKERKATLHQASDAAGQPSAPPSMSNGAGSRPSGVRQTSIT